MRRPLSIIGMLITLAVLSLGTLSSAVAAEEEDANLQEIPLEKKKKKLKFEENYRYDWEERHLSFGLNLGGALAAGNTLNTFPYGGTVTPFFKGAFGDGNAIQLDLTVGYLPILDGSKAEWLFFRTPIMPGSQVQGYVAFAAPNLQFRYELELGSSISKRSPYLFWGGLGLGALVSYGNAQLMNNGTDNVYGRDITAMEVFFDVVPTMGFKLRLGEFGYFELGARQHLLIPLASKIEDDAAFVTGQPTVIPEFFISTARTLDVFFGFSYDFK